MMADRSQGERSQDLRGCPALQQCHETRSRTATRTILSTTSHVYVVGAGHTLSTRLAIMSCGSTVAMLRVRRSTNISEGFELLYLCSKRYCYGPVHNFYKSHTINVSQDLRHRERRTPCEYDLTCVMIERRKRNARSDRERGHEIQRATSGIKTERWNRTPLQHMRRGHSRWRFSIRSTHARARRRPALPK